MSRHFSHLKIQNWHKAAERKTKHMNVSLPDAYQPLIGKGIRCICSLTGKTHLKKLIVYIMFVYSITRTICRHKYYGVN